MRLLVTADLHFNHARSRAGAEALIDEMNTIDADVLLVVGDTAVNDGDDLEACLSRFRFTGPKLFVAGNHELWTRGPDSYAIFTQSLPRRVRSLGWHWLEDSPFVSDDRRIAIAGTIGWYDYSFAVESLDVPRRFYEAKVSPGAAARLGTFGPTNDVSPHAMEFVARWNDGKFVKLQRSDETFLDERLASLSSQLNRLRDVPNVIVASHHVPFAELLPPRRGAQWDFARAYLGSDRIGELIREHENVSHVLCGHSHFPMEAKLGPIHAINLGGGYRSKVFRIIEIDRRSDGHAS